MNNDPLLERVAAFLRPLGLLRPDALILVAVSGGPDSLCLLHLLNRLRHADGPALHVAHLDHGARGAQARVEAAAVADLAAAWGLPSSIAHRDVPALARKWRQGFQAAARRTRYTFLAETALAVGAHAVATAHQADDQAETVLLHALRGAGLAGLRGMRPVTPWGGWGAGEQESRRAGEQEGRPSERRSPASERAARATLPCSGASSASDAPPLRSERSAGDAPPLIRPLLAVPRAETVAYCGRHDLHPFEDPSNRAPRFARVRVRRIMPLLAAENPRVVAALGRTATLCADDYDFILGQLDAIWPTLAADSAGVITLRREPWAGLHPSLQRYALRRAATLLGTPELSMEQVEAARALSTLSGRRMALGPRLWLAVDQIALVLSRAAGRADEPTGPTSGLPQAGSEAEERERRACPQLAADELALSVPGVTALGGGWACVATSAAPTAPDPWWVALDAETLDGPLRLRTRRAGDRFRPAGGRGSRKLQDFFVDRRVPRGLRDHWPILATPGAVVWVSGLRADERFRAKVTTQSTIWIGIVSCELS